MRTSGSAGGDRKTYGRAAARRPVSDPTLVSEDGVPSSPRSPGGSAGRLGVGVATVPGTHATCYSILTSSSISSVHSFER